MYNNDCAHPSLKNKIKSSICCFRSRPDQLEAHEYHECDHAKQPRSPRSPRSPYGLLKHSMHDMEGKDLRRSLLSRLSSHPSKSRKPHGSSADFAYDPLSYSLNFEDDRIRDDELGLSFSSRLPISPERSPESSPERPSDAPMVSNVSREIMAYT